MRGRTRPRSAGAKRGVAKRRAAVKKVVSKIKSAARAVITGDTRFQTKPPAGKTYLRGRLVNMAPKRKKK